MLAIAASPDGSRIYVGGDFTTVDGGNRYRIAAFNTATGAVISSFRPVVDSQVRAIAATNTAVYVGGTFSTVNGVARPDTSPRSTPPTARCSTWAAERRLRRRRARRVARTAHRSSSAAASRT